MANSVTIRTTAPGATQAATDLDKVKTAVMGIGGVSAGAFKSLGEAGLAIGGSVILAGKIGDVAKQFGEFLGNAAKAALDEEKNVAKLTASLEANVKGFDGNTTAIEAHIKKLEDLGFSDDALRDGLARIVAVTHDVDEAFAGVTLAMDLARFKGIDLETATTAIAKLYAGDYSRALKSVGISTDGVKDKTQALALLQSLVAGQAETYAKTTAGTIDAMNIKFQDANEELGGHLLPTLGKTADIVNQDVIPAFGNLSDAFGNFVDLVSGEANAGQIQDFFGMIPQAVRDLIPGMHEAGVALGQEAAQATIQGFIQSEHADNFPVYQQMGEEGAHHISAGFHSAIMADKAEMARDGAFAAAAAADAFNEKVLSERGNAEDAWTKFVDMMKHPLDTAAELAALKGDLASKKMIQGLASNDPQVRQWAEDTRDTIQNRIDDLTNLLGADGRDAGQQLATDLANQADDAGRAAAEIMRRIEAALHDVQVNVGVNQDPGHVPGGGRAGGGPVKANTAYIVGEQGEELFVPKTDGTIVPHAQMSKTMGGAPGNVAVHVNLSVRNFAASTQHYARLQPVGGF